MVKTLFESGCVDLIAKRFDRRRERLFRLTIRRNVAARCVNFAVCNTQQLYPRSRRKGRRACAEVLGVNVGPDRCRLMSFIS